MIEQQMIEEQMIKEQMIKEDVRWAFCVLIIILAFFVTGCLKIPKSGYPDKHYFVLDVCRSEGIVKNPSEAILKIQKFYISPRYEGKSFVYRKGEVNYESDFYNEFFISANDLITEQVCQWFAESGLFRNVMDVHGLLEPDYILEGKITDLYGDYREKKAPKAVLGIGFVLFHDVSAHSEMVFQKRYRQEVLLKETSPETLARGWSDALWQILEKFEKDLLEINKVSGK